MTPIKAARREVVGKKVKKLRGIGKIPAGGFIGKFL